MTHNDPAPVLEKTPLNLYILEPLQPQGLRFSLQRETTLTIAWDALDEGLTDYTGYRARIPVSISDVKNSR